jgi:hypothetical protein
MYKVQEPGWYAFDDNHVPVLGPFQSRKDCEKAIKDSD